MKHPTVLSLSLVLVFCGSLLPWRRRVAPCCKEDSFQERTKGESWRAELSFFSTHSNLEMGLVSESSWRQCCRRTTKTEHKKLLQQAANCSFTVSLSIMGSLLMLLQISAAAGATRMSTEAQTSGEGAVAAPVMQLTHRMAGLEGSKAMRQEGTGMTMEHYNRLLEHDKLRFNNIMMQQQQKMRGRQDFEVVDFTLNGTFNPDGYIQIQTLIIIILSSPSLLLLHLLFFIL